LENMLRTEAAPRRTALGKLSKDYDRVKVNIQAIVNQSSLIKVVNERGEVETFARTSSSIVAKPNPTGNGTVFSMASSSSSSRGQLQQQYQQQQDANDSNISSGNSGTGPALTQQQQQQRLMQITPVLQGQEVDDAIMEERDRDIKKMNQDLLLVNEMFRYVIYAPLG
jgi:hypothetical protein